ncbi:MAG: sulfotransferase [Vicinamibacterales bacterium]
MRVLSREWFMGLFGHSQYTPFVVVGRSRVGSNLLRSLLNAHPHIVAFGEVFRDVNELDWDHTGYFQSSSVRDVVQREPLRFLETRLFGRYPRSVRAVGFKLFYYHARDGAQAAIWPWILERRDIHVIHLKRGNLLETHVSRKRAALTGQWVNTSGRKDEAVTLTLDYDEVLADFRQTRGWEEESDRAFAGHPLLQVTYEQLASDYQAEARRLEAFLGVEPHAVQPSTFRQSTQSLSDTISNYHELKARFTGTPWTGFFTE